MRAKEALRFICLQQSYEYSAIKLGDEILSIKSLLYYIPSRFSLQVTPLFQPNALATHHWIVNVH